MYQYNQAPGQQQQPKQTCGMAVASLVLGILSFALCLNVFTGIPAVICGHVALSRIRASVGQLAGEGMAIAGLVLGYVQFVVMIPIVLMLAAIAVPNFMVAREKSQTRACIANMRNIDSALQQMMIETPREAENIGSSDQIPPLFLKNANTIHCPFGTEPYPVAPTNIEGIVTCPYVSEHPGHTL